MAEIFITFDDCKEFVLEILATLIALIALAKHGKGRRRFSLRRVRTTPELALATLASDTAITATVTGVATDTYRLVSAKQTWALRGATAGEGPITVGYNHSDYSVTEIKECLEAFGIDQGDKTSQERMNRLVRVVGTFPSSGNAVLNDGKPISTKLNWLIAIGAEAEIFAYNEDTGALTTGSVVHAAGNYWVKDATV